MTTTVNISSTPGADYTWSSASWTWADVESGKAWADAHLDAYLLEIGETADFAELVAHVYSLAKAESFAVAEARAFNYVINVLRSLGIAETYVDNIAFVLSVSESVNFAEQLAKNFGINKSETVTFVEALAKNYVMNVARAVAFAEAFGRTIGFLLSVSEGFSTSEALTKAMGLKVNQALSIVDSWRRRSNSVISEMVLKTGEITVEDFETLLLHGHAVGYEPFREFMTGDYEYQKAMFRVMIKAMSLDVGKVEALKLVVDVPDVNDSGTATITTASTGIAVTFNRVFHAVPDVTLTLKGGTIAAIPRIEGSPTTTGFTAVLLDTTGAKVTGTFTWAADGY